MDNSAVEAIAALAINKETNRVIVDLNTVILPEKHSIRSLEQFKQKPDRFRGTYKTNIIGEFTDYIEEYSTANTAVFIDQTEMSAKAILDMGNDGNPQWGEHKVLVTLKKTPAYAALLQFCNGHLEQQAFIDFAEDWQEHIQFYHEQTSPTEQKTFAQHIKTLRKLTVKSTSTADQTTSNFAASRSALETIEVQATGQEPPAGFRFKTIPYEGFPEVTFTCQLRAVSNDKDVKLKYRIGKLETIQEAIAEEFRDTIKASADALRIFIGNMAYQEK
jgi:uncharacterized protein YfdQ (DUF2303 family)